MKKTKNIISFATLGTCIILLFAACSNDIVDPQQEQQKSISFSGSLQDGGAISRAEQGLEDLLDNDTFKAWAYKNTANTGDDYTAYQVVMSNYTVNYETGTGSASNTNGWEYVGQGTNQTIKYWDYSAKAYRFFAYALGNGTASSVSVDTSDDTKVSLTSSINVSTDAGIAAAPYFSELWLSNDKVADYGKPVTLRFLKPLARVRFLFTYAGNLDFGREELSQIRFYPSADPITGSAPKIATAGNVTVSYPLKGTSTEESWSVSPTGTIDAFTIDWYTEPDPSEVPAGVPANSLPSTWPNTPEKWYTVLPATSQGDYTLQVAIFSPDVKTATVPAEYMVWEPGYEYTYVFKITERGGVTIDVIQVAIKDWSESLIIDRPVFNW